MTHSSVGTSFVYAGTLTTRGSKGIHLLRFDERTGALTPLGLAAEMPNPTFLCLHPTGRFLYSVSEVRESGGRKNGAVNAFAPDPETGRLTFLNAQASGGAGPCHVHTDATGRWLLAANYAAGSVAVLPVAADGRLAAASDLVRHHGSSVHPGRQSGPHAHAVALSPDNRFVLAADLGLDRVLVYRLDVASGRLRPGDPPAAAVKPGAGPRHLAFHPRLPCLYLLNELDSTIVVFAWDAGRGILTGRQTLSTLPGGFSGANTAAEVACDGPGRFLYASNRGHDSLAVFRIDGTGGLLSLVAREPTLGREPRHFALHPSGRWLLAAHQESDSIVVFRRDPDSGRLTPAGRTDAVSMPVCLLFFPLRFPPDASGALAAAEAG